MNSSLTHYVEHYFAPHPSQQVRELFVSKTIQDFATHAIMLFEPIYLHVVVGFTIPQTLTFYAALYAIYFFFLPVGGRISRKRGNERTMLLSSPFLIIWYLALLAMPLDRAYIAIALIAIVIQKILYWPSYHADFAAWSGRAERGREVSTSIVLTGVATTLAPAFGGFVIAYYGFKTLFLLACALILLSNVPLLKTPEFFVPQPFPYWAAMKRPFKRANWAGSVAFFGHGEDMIAAVAWPLFIAIVIPDLGALGVIVSVAMLVNVAVILYVGRLTDEGDRTAVLRSGTYYTAAAWLLRPFTLGGFGVFMMDSFYRVSKNMFGVPLYAGRYDEANLTRNEGVMESVISYEMALALGKAAGVAAAAAILAWWPLKTPDAWSAVFVLAGLWTAFYLFMPGRARVVTENA
ncbi:MAG: hypothetical protein RLZZ324_203 [Candidatus Parcubacteria bacterium]|jgi:hypothetical protein